MDKMTNRDGLLQDLLICSSQKYPDKTAVVSGDESISYGDLRKQSEKLATVLIKRGIKRGDRVGMLLPKSIKAILAIHGILMCGATYVPLDIKSPDSRLSYVIMNCGIQCLLVTSSELERVSEMSSSLSNQKTIVVLDDIAADRRTVGEVKIIWWQDVLKVDEEPSSSLGITQSNLAYILYTSGSTGLPKGVMISHRNALFFVDWAYDVLGGRPNDRFANHAPLHFDLSILDIFVCFKSGGTLVLVPDMISIFPIQLARWIDENQVTVWYSVPSILTMLVSQGKLSSFKFEKLRYIIFAGEVFPVKFLRELMMLIPHVTYYNLYGPTETNVITYYKVCELPESQVKPIPIGKACEGVKLWIESETGEKVTTLGENGELVAQGPCVAYGYWGDQEKTEKSFSRGDKGKETEDNIYRTGDLVSADEDGNYVYLGRRDHMIKTRGYRVELGEIEAVLYNHPDVNELAVIAVPDDLIGNRIKSFIALNRGAELSSHDIRIYCGRHIPPYMVPETVEFVERLPKTSTGKIDKNRLLQGME